MRDVAGAVEDATRDAPPAATTSGGAVDITNPDTSPGPSTAGGPLHDNTTIGDTDAAPAATTAGEAADNTGPDTSLGPSTAGGAVHNATTIGDRDAAPGATTRQDSPAATTGPHETTVHEDQAEDQGHGTSKFDVLILQQELKKNGIRQRAAYIITARAMGIPAGRATTERRALHRIQLSVYGKKGKQRNQPITKEGGDHAKRIVRVVEQVDTPCTAQSLSLVVTTSASMRGGRRKPSNNYPPTTQTKHTSRAATRETGAGQAQHNWNHGGGQSHKQAKQAAKDKTPPTRSRDVLPPRRERRGGTRVTQPLCSPTPFWGGRQQRRMEDIKADTRARSHGLGREAQRRAHGEKGKGAGGHGGSPFRVRERTRDEDALFEAFLEFLEYRRLSRRTSHPSHPPPSSSWHGRRR